MPESPPLSRCVCRHDAPDLRGHDPDCPAGWRCPTCGFYPDTPNHELGCPDGRNDPWWRFTMTGLPNPGYVRVRGRNYEDAVCEFEAWLADSGIERWSSVAEQEEVIDGR